MDAKLYYTPPTDAVFEEVREKAIEIWNTYDDQFGYASGKIERIKDIGNIQDNVMYMVAMFDWGNQNRLARLLSDEAKLAIRERMVDGGQPEEFIAF